MSTQLVLFPDDDAHLRRFELRKLIDELSIVFGVEHIDIVDVAEPDREVLSPPSDVNHL